MSVGAVKRAHGRWEGALCSGGAAVLPGAALVRPLDGLDTAHTSVAARILADGLARAGRCTTEPTP